MEYIKISDVCERLGVSRDWVNRHICPCCKREVWVEKKRRYVVLATEQVLERLGSMMTVSSVFTRIDFIQFAKDKARTKSAYDSWMAAIEAGVENSDPFFDSFINSLTDDGLTAMKKRYVGMDVRKRLPDQLIEDLDVIDHIKQIVRNTLCTKSEDRLMSIKDFDVNSLELAYRQIYEPGWYIVRIGGRSFYYYTDRFLYQMDSEMDCPLFFAKALL